MQYPFSTELYDANMRYERRSGDSAAQRAASPIGRPEPAPRRPGSNPPAPGSGPSPHHYPHLGNPQDPPRHPRRSAADPEDDRPRVFVTGASGRPRILRWDVRFEEESRPAAERVEERGAEGEGSGREEGSGERTARGTKRRRRRSRSVEREGNIPSRGISRGRRERSGDRRGGRGSEADISPGAERDRTRRTCGEDRERSGRSKARSREAVRSREPREVVSRRGEGGGAHGVGGGVRRKRGRGFGVGAETWEGRDWRRADDGAQRGGEGEGTGRWEMWDGDGID